MPLLLGVRSPFLDLGEATLAWETGIPDDSGAIVAFAARRGKATRRAYRLRG